MSQNLRRILKYTCFVLLLLLAFSAISTGDVGDFNDYDSGSSWSDSSSDSWSDSSSDRWSSSSEGSSSSHSSSIDIPIELIGLFWLFVFIGIFVATSMGSKRGSMHQAVGRQVKWSDIPDNTQDITQTLQETDPAFNATAFLEWAKEVFLKLQDAWMERDWEQVRTFESPELYAQHERQLKEYKRLGRINILERINVNNAYFFSLTKGQEWETLSVVMNVRMIDYIIDEHSRQVLKGDPNRDCFLSYFYVFKRKAGVQTTTAKQEAGTIACPNCGAPTHVVSSGRCEYCNFVITVKDHGWVLTDIIGIKPPYNYGPGGVTIQTKPEE